MILCCGEALIDMLPRRTEQGETAYLPAPGGSVFNSAVALGRLGVPAGFFSGLSTDLFGRALERRLGDAAVDLRLCVRSPRPTTLAFVDLDGGHASYTFYDENTAGRTISIDDLPVIGEEVDSLLFGGISLVSEPCGSAFEVLMEREWRRRVIMLDPNIRADFIPDRQAHLNRMRRLLSKADIVKLSEEDLAWLREEMEPEAVVQSWLERGPRLVVVTRGRGETAAFTKGGVVRTQPQKVDVVDTIGAGDTFNAGILTALHEAGLLVKDLIGEISDAHVRDMMEFATRAAAVTVSRVGADPPWRTELP